MKKILIFIMLVSHDLIQSQFVDFLDTTSNNRFLGLDMSMCSTTTNNSSKNYQKSYDCGNDSITGLLNVNFLSPELLGQQFYLFNNFIYWLGVNQSSDKEAKSQVEPDKYFSGAGVFMVNLGTSSYLKHIIAPTKTCPDGQTLLMAQLKYNDGNSLASWSQDAICLAPTDTFVVQISNNQDDSIPAAINATSTVDTRGIDWMADAGPSGNYAQAGDSPRKVRLIRNGGTQVQVAVVPTITRAVIK